MDKVTVLQAVRALASKGELTEDELVGAFESGKSGNPIRLPHRRFGIAEVFYYIGGAIVFLGIAVLIGQQWPTLHWFVRILATFGSGLVAYMTATLLAQDERTRSVSVAFYLISALTLPLGLVVTFHEFGYDIASHAIQSAIAGILFVTYLLSLVAERKPVLGLFSIIFGTWLFFSLTNYLLGSYPEIRTLSFEEYRILFVGLSYLFLGFSVRQHSTLAPLSGPLYSVGTIAFLGAALALGGWFPNQKPVWEVVFPGLAFGITLLSLSLKSKSMLVFGALFFMGYILKITAEYFKDNLGWPLALVLAGFLLIGIGYLTLYLNRKYIKENTTAALPFA